MMKFLFIRVVILLVVSILCDTSPYVCDKSRVPCGCGRTSVGIQARIVNGEDSMPYSWPMIVSLRRNQQPPSHFCGGTILSESYVLTAAHCVDGFVGATVENITIAANVYNLSQPDQIIRQVDKIIIHPLWQTLQTETQYDIAILHLTEPLDLEPNSSISRTCLPPRQNTVEEMLNYPANGTSLVAIGWGTLEWLGRIPDTLQQVTIQSIHHLDKICANSIHDPSVHFCAGLYEGGKSPCHGDSGGPILQWIGDRWEQVGIVSYGEEGCGTKGYPGVFTRISYFHDWIQSHILDNNQTTASDNETVNTRVLYRCYSYRGQCGCSRRNVVLSPSTIVENEDALPYSWSMVVSIRVGSTNQHLCSGTVLENSYILTAAHCLTNRSVQDLTIEAGMYYLSESDVIIRQVDRIYIHPNYTVHANQYINDIAILHLLLPVDAYDDKNISRTCLPPLNPPWMEKPQRPVNGTPLVITGWNITNRVKSPGAKILQQAEVYAIDDEKSNCSVSDDQRQFCAGRFENDKDICYGSAFGDPVFQWTNPQWIQVGLASYCNMSGGLGVFTSLANYSDWIQAILISGVIQTSNTYHCDKKAPCGCGQTDVNITTSGVLGSDDAIEHSWPMIVSIQFYNSHRCAGSILSDSFILTSVSCITSFSDNSTIEIIAGINKLSETTVVRRKVDQIYLHPNYSSSTSNLHDIAIIRLDQPFPLNAVPSRYSKTCVPKENDFYLQTNSLLAVIGWTRAIFQDEESDVLEQMSVRMIDSEDRSCSYYINNTYQFCVKPANNERHIKISSLCRGTTGGPVLMYTNNHWEQVGIVSDPYGCYDGVYAKIYTRLSPYLEWIKNVTNSSFATYPSLTDGIENTTSSSFSTSTSPNNNSGIRNQRRNNFIFDILFLLVVMFL